MKKYLLLIEDEELWAKFKKLLSKDINTEIIDLIKSKIKGGEAHRSVHSRKFEQGGKK